MYRILYTADSIRQYELVRIELIFYDYEYTVQVNLGELGKTLGIPEGSQLRKVKNVNKKIRTLLRSQNFCVVIQY